MNAKRILLAIETVCVVATASALSLGCVGESTERGVDRDAAEKQRTAMSNTQGMPSRASSVGDDSIPHEAQILMKVYPDFVKGFRDGKLVMSDGATIIYDDGLNKSFIQLLDEADVQDMFAFTYNRHSWIPEKMQDAGRSRCEELFKKMYGASAAQVRRKLVRVNWPFGTATNGGGVNKKITSVQFTPVNGAADSLRAVVKELQRHPELHKYLASSGSFYWRAVRGAKRQSAHSYGMTIDIGVKYSNYWRNVAKSENATVKYQNKFPHKIVEIFERHGFIWGGRWYHYDTMHFEFRPEILMANP